MLCNSPKITQEVVKSGLEAQLQSLLSSLYMTAYWITYWIHVCGVGVGEELKIIPTPEIDQDQIGVQALEKFKAPPDDFKVQHELSTIHYAATWKIPDEGRELGQTCSY